MRWHPSLYEDEKRMICQMALRKWSPAAISRRLPFKRQPSHARRLVHAFMKEVGLVA